VEGDTPVRHFWTVVALVAIFTFLLAPPASTYTGVASYYDLTGNYLAGVALVVVLLPLDVLGTIQAAVSDFLGET
jgi:hypothetical protein